MEIISNILIWIAKSLLILLIFYFFVPTLINTATRNSWIKLPIMLLLSVVAGVFMAWLNYVPGLLFLIWIMMTHYSIQSMLENKFIRETDLFFNKPLFYVSGYSYVILSCLLAFFFQAEIVDGTPNAPGIPLWHYIIENFNFNITFGSMPRSLPFSLIVVFICFFGFLNTHQRHASRFRGSSQNYYLALNISMIIGTIINLSLLIYFGVKTTWYWPFVLIIVGSVIGGPIFGLVDYVLGTLIMSLASFIGWPISAYIMYKIIGQLNP